MIGSGESATFTTLVVSERPTFSMFQKFLRRCAPRVQQVLAIPIVPQRQSSSRTLWLKKCCRSPLESARRCVSKHVALQVFVTHKDDSSHNTSPAGLVAAAEVPSAGLGGLVYAASGIRRRVECPKFSRACGGATFTILPRAGPLLSFCPKSTASRAFSVLTQIGRTFRIPSPLRLCSMAKKCCRSPRKRPPVCVQTCSATSVCDT